jgi:DNA-binding NtrC family response regulator
MSLAESNSFNAVSKPDGVEPTSAGGGTYPRRSIADSPVMQALHRQIDKVALTDATVLIVGESGTGKEMIAKALHEKSRRNGNAFVPVNCGAIPANLIEAALFGHEKGSFTGASAQHHGYFEHATGGTILLDEITEMAPGMQVKLLRVLETGRFHRVGGMNEIKVNVRIMAATNRNLKRTVTEGRFREDLLYRLAVFPLYVPSLRERGPDIEQLALHFLDAFNRSGNTNKRFSRHALESMRTYSWPGNVRELKNAVYRGYILGGKEVEIAHPSPSSHTAKPSLRNGELTLAVGTPLAVAQREIILATLSHYADDKRQAARALGISLKTLYNRLESYQQPGSKSEISGTPEPISSEADEND